MTGPNRGLCDERTVGPTWSIVSQFVEQTFVSFLNFCSIFPGLNSGRFPCKAPRLLRAAGVLDGDAHVARGGSQPNRLNGFRYATA